MSLNMMSVKNNLYEVPEKNPSKSTHDSNKRHPKYSSKLSVSKWVFPSQQVSYMFISDNCSITPLLLKAVQSSCF